MKISPNASSMMNPGQQRSASPVTDDAVEAGEWITVSGLPDNIHVPFSLLDFMDENTDLDPTISLRISEWGDMYLELTGEQGLLSRAYLAEDSDMSSIIFSLDNQIDRSPVDSGSRIGLYLQNGAFPFARIINEKANEDCWIVAGYYICEPSESGRDVRYYRLDKYAGEVEGSIEILVSTAKDLDGLKHEIVRL